MNKTLWWFEEGKLAGVGRPGFGRCHWTELSLEEGALFSWLGRATALELSELAHYCAGFAPKVARFYGLSEPEAQERLQALQQPDALMAALASMNERAALLSDFTLAGARLQVQLNMAQVGQELEQLHQMGVRVLVSLTELPLLPHPLLSRFELHHLPVEDVTPPSDAQVRTYAQVLERALCAGRPVATHCLAGIGRTSTMLIAAHLLWGRDFQSLVQRIQARNPAFQLKGPQVDYLRRLARSV